MYFYLKFVQSSYSKYLCINDYSNLPSIIGSVASVSIARLVASFSVWSKRKEKTNCRFTRDMCAGIVDLFSMDSVNFYVASFELLQ